MHDMPNIGLEGTTHVKMQYTREENVPGAGFEVIIGGDWNDGDDITTTHKYKVHEMNDFKVIALVVMDRFSRYCDQDNQDVVQAEFPDLSDEDAEEIGEIIQDMLPWGAPDGAEFHTVYVDSILFVDTDGSRYKVVLEPNHIEQED